MPERTRLYLITPPAVDDPAAFRTTLMSVLAAGDVACLQIRLKSQDGIAASDDHIRRLGREIIGPVQDLGIAVVLNDRPDLAAELGADGVHIGQDDAPYTEARRWVGEDGIVGVTCHDSRHLAMVAGEQGADYVAFGAFFQTRTKTPKAKADPEILSWWQEMTELPCVAIGGVTVDTAEALARAGADFLAVSSGVWSHPHGPEAAVRAFNEVFDQLASEHGR